MKETGFSIQKIKILIRIFLTPNEATKFTIFSDFYLINIDTKT